ncbi:interferon beta [Diceros bicornis minor]|uniref:interferon beta n=1 Tax=Diceros bicornis minor TaxID=77932 RepID=UPI0026EB7555|nr:interferon beta [Diceros bicornis minor]
MTNRCILQMALLLCFCTVALSRNYNLLRSQLRSSNSACQNLLRQLNGAYCREDRMNFEVPKEIEQPQQLQKEDAVLVIYEMLRQTFGIFRRNFASTGWNETIVERLHAEVHLQMDRLETNVGEITEKENFAWENTPVPHVRKYYARIVQYLKAKKYSRCAWTTVQAEILRNFSFLTGLLDYLQN